MRLSIQSQGASTAMYKHILDYCCSNGIKWFFGNPISARACLLFERWGMMLINKWELLSLINLYKYFFSENKDELLFPFYPIYGADFLQTKNEEISITLFPHKEILKVNYKKKPASDEEIRISDIFKINRSSSAIKLCYDWNLDTQSGIISNLKYDITIHPPTATPKGFSNLIVPIDDIKSPDAWNYKDGKLKIFYQTFYTGIKIEASILFTRSELKIELYTSDGFIPRMSIEHSPSCKVGSVEKENIIVANVKYFEILQKIYSSLINSMALHLIINVK